MTWWGANVSAWPNGDPYSPDGPEVRVADVGSDDCSLVVWALRRIADRLEAEDLQPQTAAGPPDVPETRAESLRP